ncbi:MAG: 23S rRNA (adenine(2503)-C(2))-methyltransferase RlmN [Deltaproteobacteria bacterium]|nr:23S rRNA (adenine(2503)-C(2))-methyltransferase RlmN [Deltaproteobacteria bacterium]
MSWNLQAGLEPLSALPEELRQAMVGMDQPAYRGDQLFKWLHGRGVLDPLEMTDLPAQLRERLAGDGPVCDARPGQVLRSEDGTRKIEIVLGDGLSVETVLIPEQNKLTQCVSTQVGCAVGCVFCRSGKLGLARNLSAAEIVAQIHLARGELLAGEDLRNVVLMGIGEPLHNLGRVLRALELMTHPDGLGLSSRRVTVSTVGVPHGIERLGQATSGDAALAISLHAADDRVRRELVPGVKAGLGEIVEALGAYPLPRRRRFTIEYVLVKDLNDSDAQARQLVKLLSTLKVKVNLLPLNPHDLTDLEPPDDARIEAFQQILIKKGLTAIVRRRRGADIGAACGQLLSVLGGAVLPSSQ